MCPIANYKFRCKELDKVPKCNLTTMLFAVLIFVNPQSLAKLRHCQTIFTSRVSCVGQNTHRAPKYCDI